jgi:hypothetical protein
VVVGVFQEAGVDLHLPLEDRLERLVHVVPGRDDVRSSGQLGVCRNHAEFLLPGDDRFALRVPATGELTRVLVRPFGRHVVRGVGGAGGEVDEERLVRGQRLLGSDPVDRVVGQILGEVVTLLG